VSLRAASVEHVGWSVEHQARAEIFFLREIFPMSGKTVFTRSQTIVEFASAKYSRSCRCESADCWKEVRQAEA
jgi:hypothetical protein